MIQANELRIGNKFMGAGMIQTVKAIETYNPEQPGYEHLILVEESRSQYKPVDIDGIPLTPEILEKAGFVLNSFKQYEIVLPNAYSCADRLLYFSGDYLYLEETAQRRHNSDLIALWNKDLMNNFYLHQLQNLYFALTGEELTINL